VTLRWRRLAGLHCAANPWLEEPDEALGSCEHECRDFLLAYPQAQLLFCLGIKLDTPRQHFHYTSQGARETVDHVALLVSSRTVLDLTFRQFDSACAHPLIVPAREYKAWWHRTGPARSEGLAR
jgi:hypothetical protein